MPGLINLDFADIRSVMQEIGKAMMGTGEGEGEYRTLEAAERAIPIRCSKAFPWPARGVIISILGGEDMKPATLILSEFNKLYFGYFWMI